MLDFFFALVEHPFLWMALLAGCTASFAGGVIGSYVVVKKIVSMSGSIAHSVLGGMGLFLWLRRVYGLTFLTPLQGALISALAAALLMGWIHLKYRQREDTLIATIWSTGMSLGVIFIALTPGYNVELLNFLFGNILWVSTSDLQLLLGLDLVIGVTVALFYRRFLAICFDEEQALLQKVPVHTLYLLLLSLVAIAIVLLIQVVGAILVITLLAIPASIASLFTQTLWKIMGLATLLGVVFSLSGLYAAYTLNSPPGATISLVAAACYALSLLTRRLRATH
jgi:zinc transport system permease protein